MQRIVKEIRVGAKVIRGRDWDFKDQDCDDYGNQTVGVVIGDSREDGWARVKWVNATDSYRIGADGKYSLYYFEEPRVVRTNDIGAKVIRGRDWSWYTQDCNKDGKQTVGTIIRSGNTTLGWVFVKWGNQQEYDNTYTYKIGLNGFYDLYYAESYINDYAGDPLEVIKILDKTAR